MLEVTLPSLGHKEGRKGITELNQSYIRKEEGEIIFGKAQPMSDIRTFLVDRGSIQ
jgi:hypothetical protein